MNLLNVLMGTEITDTLSSGIAKQKRRMFHVNDFMHVYNVLTICSPTAVKENKLR
jgi:hypothetical protein